MAQAVRDFEKSYNSSNDLSAGTEYLIMKLDTSDTSGESVIPATAGTDPIVGILQNKPKATQAAVIRHGGTSKVIAGGTITVGDLVTATTGGQAVTTTTNKNIAVGRALMSAVANDIFEVLLGVFVPFSA